MNVLSKISSRFFPLKPQYHEYMNTCGFTNYLDRAAHLGIVIHRSFYDFDASQGFLLHVHRVVTKLNETDHPTTYLAVAWLSEVTNHSTITIENLLIDYKMPAVVVRALEILEQEPVFSENVEELTSFYNDLKEFKIAATVKKFQLIDRLEFSYLIQPLELRLTLEEKYKLGIKILE